jgi:hypothetical protein
MEMKLHQVAALMAARDLFGPEADREAQFLEVRDTRARLRRWVAEPFPTSLQAVFARASRH